MKNEPKTPDLLSGKTQVASDMPVRKAVVPQRVAAPPAPLTLEDVAPAIRRRPRLQVLSGSGKWVAACGLCALLGSLLGSFLTTRTTQMRVDKSNQRLLLAQTLEQLHEAGVDVKGSISLQPEAEAYAFPTIDFSDIASTRDMRKALRIASALPGVTTLTFYSPSSPVTRGGVADESVMRVVGDHFPVLDTLDVSCASVSEFRGLEGKTVRHLKIVNAPLIMESFTSLKFINGVSELSVGWPDRNIPKDSLVRSDGFRKALVDAMATMIDLKKVNLYEVPLDKEDREKLAKLEIVAGRLAE